MPFGNLTSHIDPVRSSTIMMSRGFTEHGKQAVAFAETVSESTPTIRPKNVGTLATDLTVMAFTDA